jgi:hypothetical protein
MANAEHVKVVRQGAAAIAEWRRQNPGVPLDLTGADLGGADLSGANLSDADLSGADLSDADFTGADLFGAKLVRGDLHGAHLITAGLAMADLTGADLTDACLMAANLTLANLRESNLSAADLRMASLSGAAVSGANLHAARLDFTSLGHCDLSQATGLAAVKHEGPSSVGVDALIASFRGAGNKLTPDLETFFLGAGVPMELLAALPQIVAEVKYYSCFIAYGQPDLDFAKRLRDDLATRGVPCWLYDLDATPGERTWAEIGRERRQADKMVVVCSAAALVRDGVLKEIEEQIDENPDKMVPISRDDIWVQTGFRVVRGSRDLGPFLRDRNYADFSDESRYEESMQRLLKALRRKAE